MCRRWDL